MFKLSNVENMGCSTVRGQWPLAQWGIKQNRKGEWRGWLQTRWWFLWMVGWWISVISGHKWVSSWQMVAEYPIGNSPCLMGCLGEARSYCMGSGRNQRIEIRARKTTGFGCLGMRNIHLLGVPRWPHIYPPFPTKLIQILPLNINDVAREVLCHWVPAGSLPAWHGTLKWLVGRLAFLGAAER